MLNIILFGPPGAGKGTQSEMLKKEHKLIHLSTGDLLRAERSAQTDLGKKAEFFINQGKLVPDEVVIGMIEHQLEAHEEAQGFIFDGFPRTKEQARALDEMLKRHQTQVSGMIELKVDQIELVERLLLRGATSGRADDTEDVIAKRIREYEDKTKPVADYYREQQKHFAVDGVGEVEEIARRINQVVEEMKR
ncbi:MAG: adenylate kinase [Bacteroidia bacterium]